MCICTCATNDYLYLLKQFYCSLRNFHKDIIFYAYLINCNSENFSPTDDNVIIRHIKKNFESKTHQRAYAVNIRIEMLKDCWGRYKTFYWMDSDTLIRKPLDGLYSFDNIHVKKRNVTDENTMYMGGICGFKSTMISREILYGWYEELFSLDDTKWEWWMDQKLLGKYINKVNPQFTSLLKTYNDYDFHYSSHIWNGKGKRKYSISFRIQMPHVLLIGNGQSAENLDGNIHNYDLVVRFNYGPMNLNDKVGYKTDLHVMNDTKKFVVSYFLKNKQKLKHCSFIKIDYQKHFLDRKDVRQKLNYTSKKLNTYEIPKILDSRKILQQFTNLPILNKEKQSTGLLTLLFFVLKGFHCDIIGFDLLTGNTCTQNHYFSDESYQSCEHDFVQEANILETLPVNIL